MPVCFICKQEIKGIVQRVVTSLDSPKTFCAEHLRRCLDCRGEWIDGWPLGQLTRCPKCGGGLERTFK